jgi:hypothetical protein
MRYPARSVATARAEQAGMGLEQYAAPPLRGSASGASTPRPRPSSTGRRTVRWCGERTHSTNGRFCSFGFLFSRADSDPRRPEETKLPAARARSDNRPRTRALRSWSRRAAAGRSARSRRTGSGVCSPARPAARRQRRRRPRQSIRCSAERTGGSAVSDARNRADGFVGGFDAHRLDIAPSAGPKGNRQLVQASNRIAGGRRTRGHWLGGARDQRTCYAIVLLPGESIDQPEKVQMHFPVADVDAEYDRLRRLGIRFDGPPEDQPWGWRHAYTHDPAGHTVELCTPLANAKFTS